MINRIHQVQVHRVRRLAPGMIRIDFVGDLEGFVTTGVGDEYVRVFLPGEGQTEPTLPIPTDDGYWKFPEGVRAVAGALLHGARVGRRRRRADHRLRRA